MHVPSVAAAVALAALLSFPASARDDGRREADERPVRVRFVPAAAGTIGGNGVGLPEGPNGDCPPTISTLTNHDFGDPTPTVIVQAGFAEQEIAAAEFLLTADDFPIILDEAQMLFGTAGASVTTTTEWSFLVWQGNPETGSLVAEFSSDDVILPHLVMPPGNNGIYIVLQTDPQDPIVIEDDGSHRFSIGFRIDAHHNQTQNPCLVAPPSSSNAFPTTDIDGLGFSSRNWLYGVNCGILGCPPNGGFARFSELNVLCRPSGDWIMNATWHSTNCTTLAGACCFPDGSCDTITESDCSTGGGAYEGDGIACFQVTCPEPAGACCTEGACSPDVGEDDCVAVGGTWLGAFSTCAGNPCVESGACCIPATGGCLDLESSTCATVGGVFQGDATACATTICFPEGACCLPDGACLDGGGQGLTPEDCAIAGGVFQGDGSTCAGVSCPLPTGACCLANGNCVVFTESDCTIVAGAWAGAASDCADGNANGTADACETACATDLDGDGQTGFSDLLAVLAAWGPCAACPEDLDDSGDVGFSDLLAVLAAWGPCA